MALPENYVDDILASSMGGKRRYNMIQNADGTVSFEDVTDYTQVGSNFGAGNVNAITGAINNAMDNLDDIMATTVKGNLVDALALKSVNQNLGYKNFNLGSTSAPAVTNRSDATQCGKAIIAYLVTNYSAFNTRKNCRFTVYDASGNTQWWVSIGNVNATTLVGTMYQTSTSGLPMYYIARSSGGADTVRPFSSGGSLIAIGETIESSAIPYYLDTEYISKIEQYGWKGGTKEGNNGVTYTFAKDCTGLYIGEDNFAGFIVEGNGSFTTLPWTQKPGAFCVRGEFSLKAGDKLTIRTAYYRSTSILIRNISYDTQYKHF